MGNKLFRMASKDDESLNPTEFKFHSPFIIEDVYNGLCFNGYYLPEEIVLHILSYIPASHILRPSLVCKNWCNIIKSDLLWGEKFTRRYNRSAKKLPWYVHYCLFTTRYFDRNHIQNGNGQHTFKHWKVVLNYGDAFRIEDPPTGADALPQDVPEFYGHTSCFATSYYECNKTQEISFATSPLMRLVFNTFKPSIYLSEWVAGRFDCGSVYFLCCNLHQAPNKESKLERNQSEEPCYTAKTGTTIKQWAGGSWSKIELTVKPPYPDDITRIVFQHEGKDTQFWKGHYGSKMAGGVLRILFDSIEPVDKTSNLETL